MKGEESVRGLIELWGESESKLKHHGERWMDEK